jgi:hypothetical protein
MPEPSDERYWEWAEGLRQELAATLAVYGSAGSRFRDPIIAALRAAVAEATARKPADPREEAFLERLRAQLARPEKFRQFDRVNVARLLAALDGRDALLFDASCDALPWVAAERGEAARWLLGEAETAHKGQLRAPDNSPEEAYQVGLRDAFNAAAAWLAARGTAEPLPPGRAREAADRRLVLLREVRRLWGRPEPGVVDLLERIEKEVEGG